VDDQYGESHQVELVPGTWLAELMGQPSIPVNSLHGQGIKTLAKGLALAHAEDGLIEAIHAPPSPLPAGGAVAPGVEGEREPHSIKLFTAFGDACRRFRRQVG
jgi:putative glutamine amidotransferase